MELEKLSIDRGPGPKRAYRPRSRWPFWIVVAALAASVWIFRAPIAGMLAGEDPAGAELPPPVVAQSTQSARSAQTRRNLTPVSGASANGYLVARRRAALSADTPGRIVELNVQEGTVLKAGDVVARLFSDEAEATLRRTEADLAAADVAVRSAQAAIVASERRLEEARALVGTATSQRDEVQAGLTFAQQDFDRTKRLLERGAVTKEQLERAESALAQARARLTGSEAALVQVKAGVSSAESNVAVSALQKEEAEARIQSLSAVRDLARATLDKTVVRAPFDGVVVLKDAEVGEVVSPNALGGQSRGSVATMVDFSTLEVQVELPETSLDSVEVSQSAEVYLDAFSKEKFNGTVERIWPTANRQKATIEVRVRLETIDPRMRPEMGARVVFPRTKGAEDE
jgi:multidrug resistance efflux pump